VSSEEILLIIALLLSAFFSGSETAYTAAGRLALEVYARHNRFGARTAKRLHNQPTLLFSTTLVGNNLVGVLYSSLAALLLTRWGFSIEAIFVLSPILILILGEVLPKTIAREHPEKWSMLVSFPLMATRFLLAPLIAVAKGSSNLLLALFGERKSSSRVSAVTLGELRGLWGELYQVGKLDEEEVRLLNQVVSLRDRKIRDVMTPRAEMVALSVTATVEEAGRVVQSRGVSRLPVYRESLDRIEGILLAKDLLENPTSIVDVMRPPLFVPEQASVAKFLRPLRRREVGLAVVVDEYGGTAGVVSIEDVVEQLVGEIEDEHDFHESLGKPVTSSSWLVPGRALLDAVERTWGISLPSGEYDTVAGLILHQIGRIPELGETIDAEGYQLRIVAADNRRIKRVLIKRGGQLRR